MTWQAILRHARRQCTSRYAYLKLFHASDYLANTEAEERRSKEYAQQFLEAIRGLPPGSLWA